MFSVGSHGKDYSILASILLRPALGNYQVIPGLKFWVRKSYTDREGFTVARVGD